LGRQIINTKRKGMSPRTILRLVILVVLLIAIAIGTFFWLHGHAAATAWSGATYRQAFVFFTDRPALVKA
jgi:flagellar basal body-associated protein FliL